VFDSFDEGAGELPEGTSGWQNFQWRSSCDAAEICMSSKSDAEVRHRAVAIMARLQLATMHLAKGHEFRAVAVLTCDDDVLPLQSRIEGVATKGI
jgi:hypothetical protein